jgi:hypothetical protein
VRCKHEDCPRRAYTSGWCSTHYRRLRSGQPMDAPIRRYVRLQEQGSSTGNPAITRTARRKPKKPFEKEWALLKELGLA